MRCSLWMWCCQHFYATINLAPIWNLTNLKWNSKSQWNLLTRRWWELRLVTGAKHPWIRNEFFFFFKCLLTFFALNKSPKKCDKIWIFFFFLTKCVVSFFLVKIHPTYLHENVFQWFIAILIESLARDRIQYPKRVVKCKFEIIKLIREGSFTPRTYTQLQIKFFKIS